MVRGEVAGSVGTFSSFRPGLSALAAAVVREPLADSVEKPTAQLHRRHLSHLGSRLALPLDTRYGLIDVSGYKMLEEGLMC